VRWEKTVILAAVLVAAMAVADEPAKFSNESAAGIVIASGNSDTKTFSLKEEASYTWEANELKLTGSYLLGEPSGAMSARKWDLGLRYDRAIGASFGGFVGYRLDAVAGKKTLDTLYTTSLIAKF